MTHKYPPTEKILHLCPVCGGTMENSTITHEQHDPSGVFYVVHNVPASVCKQCGEVYLEAVVLEKLENIIKHTEPIKKVETPTSVFDFVKTQ